MITKLRTIYYNTQNGREENGMIRKLKDVDNMDCRNNITELKVDSTKWNDKEAKSARHEKFGVFFLNDVFYCQYNSNYLLFNLIVLSVQSV